MLSIGRMTAGSGYEYLTREVATSRHDYYAGAGEKPGQWWGDGLARLGLAGEVTEEQMEALYGHALDPATGEPLGRRFPVFRPAEEREAAAVEAFTTTHGRPPVDDELVALRVRVDEAPRRDAIAALDLTFSPVKSVSALWAMGDAHVQAQVAAAHDAAVDAALGHVQQVAGTSRAGTDGVRTVDTEGWVVARFTHRTSRARDPQLHTHCAVLNRVFCPADGRWRTLDSRAIYRLAAGGGGVYTRAIEDELTRRLGVSWDDHDVDTPTPRREVAGVPKALAREWSKRRAQVEEALDMLDEPPRTPAARAAAAQHATLRTRPAKAGTDRDPHARWRDEAVDLGVDADGLLDRVTNRPAAGPQLPDDAVEGTPALDVDQVLDQAVARLEAGQATWRRGNLVRTVAEALPPAARTAAETTTLVDRLVATAERSGRLVAIAAPDPVPVPAGLRRRDGTSVYRPAAATRYTTPGILAAEARVVAAARAADANLAVAAPLVDSILARGSRAGTAYGADQAGAVRSICGSGRAFEVLIGPAGAGKTTTVRALAATWSAGGGRVVGLAVAQTAADVLAGEAGIAAHNITRWLVESGKRHDRPEADGTRTDAGAWKMRAGDLVVIDEVGMVPTRQLDELLTQAQAAGAKVLGVGDPLQLGPVGAGGAARLVAADVGATYLHEVHRFANSWERDATLALRNGEPTVAGTYDRHGRLDGGDRDTAMAGARSAWLRDHLAGKDTLLLASSVDHVAELAGWCRGQLVALGHVDDGDTVALHDGNRAGRGDLVTTRRNDRRAGVANRDLWHVDAVGADGSIALRHARDGRSTIVGGDYAARHVELGYAVTVHAAQGRTVDTAYLIVTTGLDRELLYVGMTRGREANYAWVVTEDFLHPEFGGGLVTPTAAVESIVTQEPAVVSATEALREETASADSLRTLGPIHDDLAATVSRRRALHYLAHRFGAAVARDVGEDPACAALVALLRRAPTVGADPDRLLAHTARGDLGGAHSYSQVLAARAKTLLHRLGTGDLAADRLDRPLPHWHAPSGAVERYYEEIGGLMDQRVEALGESAVAEPPAWALQRWGPVPDNPVARAAWAQAAGQVAAYQERWGTDLDPAQLAAQQPPAHAVAQRADHRELLRWLDLDHNDIADLAQTGPDADRNGIDDRDQTGPDRDANRVDDLLDAAMAQLSAVQLDRTEAALDARRPPPLDLGTVTDLAAPAAAPDIDLGP